MFAVLQFFFQLKNSSRHWIVGKITPKSEVITNMTTYCDDILVCRVRYGTASLRQRSTASTTTKYQMLTKFRSVDPIIII